MDAPKQSGTRRSQPGDHSPDSGLPDDQNHQHDDHHHQHGDHHEQTGPGVDLPVLGHVEYRSVGFLAGLGVAGAVGVIEWPVAAAVGIGYALTRRKASDDRH